MDFKRLCYIVLYRKKFYVMIALLIFVFGIILIDLGIEIDPVINLIRYIFVLILSILVNWAIRYWVHADLRGRGRLEELYEKKVSDSIFTGLSIFQIALLLIFSLVSVETPLGLNVMVVNILIYFLFAIVIIGTELVPFQGDRVKKESSLVIKWLMRAFIGVVIANISVMLVIGGFVFSQLKADDTFPYPFYSVADNALIVTDEEDLHKIGLMAINEYFNIRNEMWDSYKVPYVTIDEGTDGSVFHVYSPCDIKGKPFSNYWDNKSVLELNLIVKRIADNTYELKEFFLGTGGSMYYEDGVIKLF